MQENKPSAALSFEASSSESNKALPEIMRKMFQLEYTKVLSESGCFSKVEGKDNDHVLEDGVKTVTWKSMVFAYPFANPSEVRPEVRMNIYKNLLARMHEDGIL